MDSRRGSGSRNLGVERNGHGSAALGRTTFWDSSLRSGVGDLLEDRDAFPLADVGIAAVRAVRGGAHRVDVSSRRGGDSGIDPPVAGGVASDFDRVRLVLSERGGDFTGTDEPALSAGSAGQLAEHADAGSTGDGGVEESGLRVGKRFRNGRRGGGVLRRRVRLRGWIWRRGC